MPPVGNSPLERSFGYAGSPALPGSVLGLLVRYGIGPSGARLMPSPRCRRASICTLSIGLSIALRYLARAACAVNGSGDNAHV